MLADVAHDILTFDVVDPLRRAGKSAARERAEAWLTAYDGPVGWEARDIEVTASGDVGFSHALGHVTGRLKTGAEIDMWFCTTLGFRRAGDRWSIIQEHSSAPINPENGQASLGLQPS
jgi:ketosteroid isomerase-like protein